MRIYTKSKLDMLSPTLIVIHHDDVELTWPGNLMEKLVWTMPSDFWESASEEARAMVHREAFEALFEDINRYWASLSETKQTNIFAIYKKMDQVLKAVPHDVANMRPEHYTGVCNALRKLVRQLYELMPAEALVQWWKENYPETGEHAAALDDFKGAAFSFRPLTPLFTAFIAIFQRRIGTVFKEMEAYKTVLDIGPDATSACARVRQYASAAVGNAGGPGDNESEGPAHWAMTNEEYRAWILSLVVVRRLAVVPLRSSDPLFSPITFVYKYIGQKVKAGNSGFLGAVNPQGNPALAEALAPGSVRMHGLLEDEQQPK